ncbi:MULTISPECIES: phosphotransferase [Cryobacterium]|uniref:Maltokinase n=1 Tax=Cryobacterium breve TaxID=1259258 RepID=A0ABY2J883_9MICO|nr:MULTISPECIES: phosphotransferase [Cryobacterium]TFC91153.1 phosphotransferase [Cryobacterium sp. TmT3-12]TFD01152.1 phosphotransferase [Cryobacterium breve]
MTDDGRVIALPDHLNHWVATQRWFAGRGKVPRLVSIGRWTLPATEPGVDIRTELVFDESAPTPTLYQLPLTERRLPLPGGDAALIRAAGGSYLYDGPGDPAYCLALLAFILNEDSAVPGPADAGARGELLLDAVPGDGPAVIVTSRVLSGEQSNTSIILDGVDAAGGAVRPVICKVFRMLHGGENPDVSVQSALARAGSRFVPEPVGCVVGEWADPMRPGSWLTGHLAFAQEFLPGVEDAWRAALASAGAGEDFSEQARALGEATAAVHADLAAVMPTREATPAVIAAELDRMRERFHGAVRDVPALAGYEKAVEAVFRRAEEAHWPRLQRIHGDLHLGQALEVPGRGWVLVDFEGEPLRPLIDRTGPDVPLRDVAGMLRSFSYVAGTVERSAPGNHPPVRHQGTAEWGAACRQAFLDGYAARSGRTLAGQEALLDAFELDKAIYEAVYETLNRPSWLPIPLEAVRSLVSTVSV